MRLASLALVALFALASAGTAGADAAASWKSKCQSCHGADGKSDTPMGKGMKAPDLTAPAIQEQDTAALVAASVAIKQHAASFGSLSDAEKTALIEHVKSLGP